MSDFQTDRRVGQSEDGVSQRQTTKNVEIPFCSINSIISIIPYEEKWKQ